MVNEHDVYTSYSFFCLCNPGIERVEQVQNQLCFNKWLVDKTTFTICILLVEFFYPHISNTKLTKSHFLIVLHLGYS